MPFHDAQKDRTSEGLGRCLRYCCRLKLPEKKACYCNCCPCGDEAKEIKSQYGKTEFFVLQPLQCTHAETLDEAADADDVSDEDDQTEISSNEGSGLDISEDEKSDDDIANKPLIASQKDNQDKTEDDLVQAFWDESEVLEKELVESRNHSSRLEIS